MTDELNNFLETDHVDLEKGPLFKELIQNIRKGNLKMTPQEQIEQMLWTTTKAYAVMHTKTLSHLTMTVSSQS